jgi:hypothetical protein
MPQNGYRVLFAGTAEGPDVHRVRNFAEALDRALKEGAIGSVLNMRSATDEVQVQVRARRLLGPALRAIQLELTHAYFYDNISIVRWADGS